jgi:OmpA-OmpF porin, OOP family
MLPRHNLVTSVLQKCTAFWYSPNNKIKEQFIMFTGTQKGRIVVSVALVAMSCVGCSTMTSQYPSYWTDINGKYVKDGMGHCVRTIAWTEASANADCDASLMKKAAPAPAPAPVTEAAPAPAPAVAPVAVAPRKPSIVEKAFRLEGANFATGSSKLLKAADSKLNEVVDAAREYPDVQLDVTGYTDNVGNAQQNLKLSRERANAVKAYLVKNGVASGRINTKGAGADSPIADNATAEGRAKNRRVEVRYTIREEQKN